MKKAILILPLLMIFIACEETSYIPKPPTYLRLELPEHTYTAFDDECNYAFELADLYRISNSTEENGTTCNKRIDLGPLNGMAYLRYWDIDGERPLAFYVNSANDEVDRHKLKANNIEDEQIIRSEDRVFGTLFELQGDVATPFQFYLTDSTDKFLYCEVLFNTTPKYDSLKPSLDYLKKDLKHLLNTFEWK